MNNFSILPGGDPARRHRKPERNVPGFEPVAIDHVESSSSVVVSVKGERRTVRLIGASAPEPAEANADEQFQEGMVACKFADKLAPFGSRVWLQSDVAIADSDEAIARYLWLEIPVDPDNYDRDEAQEKLLNAKVLSAGFARLDTADSAAGLFPMFESLSKDADATMAGVSYLWNE